MYSVYLPTYWSRFFICLKVDAALTQARAKWLQEYKLNLKTEQEKWEKEHQKTTAKQVAQNTTICVLINT